MSTQPGRKPRELRLPVFNPAHREIEHINKFELQTIFKCGACGAERRWGNHLKTEHTEAWLGCQKCQKVTRHFFVRVE